MDYSLLRISGFGLATKIVLHITELIHDRGVCGAVCGFAVNSTARIDLPKQPDTPKSELTERLRFQVS